MQQLQCNSSNMVNGASHHATRMSVNRPLSGENEKEGTSTGFQYKKACRSMRSTPEPLPYPHTPDPSTFDLFHLVDSQHIQLFQLNMTSYLSLLLNSDPAIFDVPTKLISSLTHNPSLDNVIPVAIRVVLLGAVVAGLRRATNYLRWKISRGELSSIVV